MTQRRDVRLPRLSLRSSRGSRTSIYCNIFTIFKYYCNLLLQFGHFLNLNFNIISCANFVCVTLVRILNAVYQIHNYIYHTAVSYKNNVFIIVADEFFSSRFYSFIKLFWAFTVWIVLFPFKFTPIKIRIQFVCKLIIHTG